ncbi:MAG: HAMP domain-containing protein [Chloroflexi bacterium]|nr:HAMP domain-containing protein [Chloroflexota bacterium]
MRLPSIRVSLTIKLFLSLVAVAICTTALVVFQAQQRTAREFDTYVVDRRRNMLTTNLAELYVTYGSWEAVAGAVPSSWIFRGLPAPMPQPWDRRSDPREPPRAFFYAAVVDEQGNVLLAGPGFEPGQAVERSALRNRHAITVDDTTVGWLVLITGEDPLRSAIDERFLRRVGSSLIMAAGAAGLLALVLSFLLSRSLTRPLRELTAATKALARGDLGHQVPVRSQDELGELARSFNTMSQALARAEHLRKQMTADVAHELRTPLSLILGHAEALDEGVLPATPETMHIIHDEARRLSRLVEDLRTLSLSDAGELRLDLRPVAVEDLATSATTAFYAQAQSHGVILETAIEPDLPPVLADPDRIMQVLSNLLSNALRFTPQHGKIIVSAKRDDARAGFVRLAVQDNGPGIPQEEIESVFERFYRADRSRAREDGGTGLGLAIARSLVETHGGRMWAESQPGDGTTVLFTLPIAAEEGGSRA